MARRPSLRRRPTLEQCEARIALSANGGLSNGPADETIHAASFTPRHAFASDNSTNTARNLGNIDGSVAVRGQYVGPFDPRDVYRFELERDGDATINLRGLSADADIYLLNNRRETVASSRNSGRQSDVIQRELAAGEYFVVVQNYSAWRGTGYSLSVSAALRPVQDPIGNTFDTAKDLGAVRGRQTITDSVGQRDGLDVFRFTIDAASRLDATLSGLHDDVDLHLYSDNGSRLNTSDRSGPASEQIRGWIAKGSYYLVVDAYDSAESSYTLSVSSSLPNTPTEPSQPTTPTPPAPSTPTPNPTAPVTETPVPNRPSPPQSTPNGPLANQPFFGSTSRDWGVNSVNAPEAWAAGYDGEGVTVAVIDSGVQTNHPDLVHSIWVNTDEIAGDGIDNDGNGYVDDVRGWDFINRDNTPTDANGHGTHVAGIIAAANNGVGGTGVAYASQIMPIRVLDANGSGSTNGVAQGIRYAVDNGAQVINLSLGGGNSQSVYSALRYAEQNNVLVVAASGNENAAIPGYPAGHSASLSNVLSVGAYTSSNRRASFSNRVGNSNATQIDAPGQSIYNTYVNGGYRSLSGTSMATPFVSGIAALAWAANPGLSAGILRNVLTQSVDSGVNGSDSLGRVNAATAIPLALSGSVSASTASISSRNPAPQSFSNSQRVYALFASSTSSPSQSRFDFESEASTDEPTHSQIPSIGNQDRAQSIAHVSSVEPAALELELAEQTATSPTDEIFAGEDWTELV